MPLPAGICEQDFWEDYYAEAFGWPPEVVERLPARFLDRNPLIRQAKAKAAKLRQGTTRGGVRDPG